MELFVDAGPGHRLWVESSGDDQGSPILLIMGASAPGIDWPDDLVARLGRHHRVIRYDHRDTGRSTRGFDRHPYPLRDLATDAITILDALAIAQAHVVGMSMGGTLVQLLLVDHPDRLLSATIFGTSVLEGAAPDALIADDDLPGPSAALLDLWSGFGEERDPEAELAWRVEHWRLLTGEGLPFDPEEFRRLEERVAAHSGGWDSPAAHALADQSGLDRGAELADVDVPTLVIDAPCDPVAPPPNAARLARAIPSAKLVEVPGLGHSLPQAVVPDLAEVLLTHTAR